jgi:TolA-binding protein
MKDDLLAQMTRALADEHDGATAVPEATRARVIRTLAERKPRRKKWLLIGVPAFVIFGGSSAWAAATGRLPEVVEQAIAVITGSDKSEEMVAKAPAKAAHKGGSFSKGAATNSEGSPQPAPEEETPAAETPVNQAESHKSVATLKLAPRPGGVDAKKDEAALAALAVYRAAHEAHFKDGNCDAAVRGYQKYLAQQPSGTFYLEAKYNLGVCLARLGRTQEARAALLPFAEGKFGDYRKAQSQELLQALGE